MAVAFVTVAGVATACPLNPAYKEDEFAFYLEDLKAKAIILAEGETGPTHAGQHTLETVDLSVDQIVDLKERWRNYVRSDADACIAALGYIMRYVRPPTPIRHDPPVSPSPHRGHLRRALHRRRRGNCGGGRTRLISFGPLPAPLALVRGKGKE